MGCGGAAVALEGGGGVRTHGRTDGRLAATTWKEWKRHGGQEERGWCRALGGCRGQRETHGGSILQKQKTIKQGTDSGRWEASCLNETRA